MKMKRRWNERTRLMLTLELARCEYVARRENVIALGNSEPDS